MLAIRKSIVYRHVAWLKALTYQLRIPKPWEHVGERNTVIRELGDVEYTEDKFVNLKPYLSDADYNYIMQKGNRASHLLSLQSKELLYLKSRGLIEDFRHMELAKLLREFYALQGKSERIKNFPFPRQYATVNYIFAWIFLILLPFGMLNIFIDSNNLYSSWLVLPFTLLVSWVFILMEMIGDYSENPFEGLSCFQHN